MKNKKIVIGGEKIFSIPSLVLNPKNNIFSTYKKEFHAYCINYTFGGHYSLLAIVDHLKLKGDARILVPSYTCESVLTTLKLRSVSYLFYKVDRDLIPNIEHIKLLCETNNVVAVIVIDYMGKSQFDTLNPHYEYFNNKGIGLIQDCVHSLCTNGYQIYGDYAYNSFRKILPFEGSLLISKQVLKIDFAPASNFKFLFNKRCGQLIRLLHVKYGLFDSSSFLNFFSKAERNYNSERIYGLSRFQKWLISKINVIKMVEQSSHYYSLLLEKYKKFTLETLNGRNYYPFGFFLIITERNKKRTALQAQEIYCPIHWILSGEIDRQDFTVSHELSESCITIPLTDMDELKFKYLVTCLDKII